MQKSLFTQKQIISLIIPLIIDQLLNTGIGFIDTLMVSSAGEAAVSAVSLVDSINRIFFYIFAALATGGAIVSSQYIGRKDVENAKNAGRQVFVVTLFISIVVTVLCIFGRKHILSLIYGSISLDVMEQAVKYFLITALAYPAIALTNTCAALFRATGNSKYPMFVSFIMNASHVILNALFIYQLNMGVAGAALSTLISRYIAAGILYLKIQRPTTILNLNGILSFQLNRPLIKTILRVGIPNGFENSMFEIGKLMILSIIATFGTASITANAVTNSLNSLTFAIGVAIGTAMLTIVGQCVGAGRYEEAKRYMIKMTGLGTVIMTVFSLLIIIFRGQIVSIFGLTDETADLTMKLIVICATGTTVLFSPAFALPNGLRAAGDVRFSMIVAIISMWTARVGLGYLFSVVFGFGVAGIWYGQLTDWFIRMTFYGWRLFSQRWTRHLVLK